jgi:hypothetical protein
VLKFSAASLFGFVLYSRTLLGYRHGTTLYVRIVHIRPTRAIFRIRQDPLCSNVAVHKQQSSVSPTLCRIYEFFLHIYNCNMATVAKSASSGRSSKNSGRTKGDAHNQDLGFLDNFSSDGYSSQSSIPNSTDHKTSEDSSEEESDYDYEYEDRRRTNKIKRGTVYTVRYPPTYHRSTPLSTTRLGY